MDTNHLRTCMALLPSLTTSNRVTGSPPSPLCWATPLAFPRPLATPIALSVGDFRGFLLVVCSERNVNQTVRKQRTQYTKIYTFRSTKHRYMYTGGHELGSSPRTTNTCMQTLLQSKTSNSDCYPGFSHTSTDTDTYQGLFSRPPSLLLAFYLWIFHLTHAHTQAHCVCCSRLIGWVPKRTKHTYNCIQKLLFIHRADEMFDFKMTKNTHSQKLNYRDEKRT